MPKSDVNVEEPVVAEEVIEETKKSTRATFEKFKAKKRAERRVPLEINGEEMELLFRAIGSTEYDKLIAKCPPTYEQKAQGASYNIDTFGPLILDKVCVDPDLTVAEWSEIWNSENWNRGEILQMFYLCTELCNRGFDIPFNENG
jgi:hypothetical protein